MSKLESRISGGILTLAAALAIGFLALTHSRPAVADDALTLTKMLGAMPIWDDGKAEISTYEVTRTLYGQDARGEATFIVVKEPWNLKKSVKSDGAGDLEVLKLHRFEEVQTKYYPYRFATSLFAMRGDLGRTLEETSTSHEWCGTTYQSMKSGAPNQASFEWRSYFESESEGQEDVAAPIGLPLIFLDALPLTLRSTEIKAGQLGRATLAGTMISNHARTPMLREVRLDASRKIVAAGSPAEIEIVVRPASGAGAAIATLRFQAEPPFLMISAEFEDGARYRLISSERRAYWPGGEASSPK